MRTARSSRGFTLIEIMLVVAILGVVLAFGAPIMFKTVLRAPLTSAVVDITGQCQSARFQAVMRGVPSELRVYGDGRIEVGLAALDNDPMMGSSDAGNVANRNAAANFAEAGAKGEKKIAPAITAPIPNASVQLSEDVQIVEIDVNFIDMKDSDVARVRFYPDGTCDEFTMVIAGNNERRKITLEVVTGLAEVTPF